MRLFRLQRRCFATTNDPFQVLGLHRNASEAEIKTKYRELAKQFHPDLNSSKQASQKMSDITTAYDILTDSKKRRQYEEERQQQSAGHASSSSSSSAYSASWGEASQMYSEFNSIFGRMASRMNRPSGSGIAQRGDDACVELEVSFVEAMRGVKKQIPVQLRKACRQCHGSGAQAGTSWSKCTTCRGTGVRRIDKGILSMGVPCTRCAGVGEILQHPCVTCKGDGVNLETIDAPVTIPAGVKNAMELRLPNMGHSGMRGGKPGHLFVTLRVLPHPHWSHIEDDIHMDVKLSLKEALIGGVKKIDLLQGAYELKFEGPVRPGTSKKLHGKVFPAPGPRFERRKKAPVSIHVPLSVLELVGYLPNISSLYLISINQLNIFN
eukprot:GEMP01052564.1.p1 GENE.GEMP01052564.1~~GEMP01052564.1.p1  ORF type:complete len:379 (+),score=84.44 GEMP01052564.1:118-1254(+)